ncbi:protein tyrosine phosphatase type IVA 3 isoform X1 [Tupaia chinensis]|uniref:protein tyrosine phosphatase type IVA 3 isoform X1 n=1 Tax=Tupaia chinensis TaxID=246437 RepID=UPI000703D547|nr:protein tyrosine phosphatase type IVA 3 isoform X1 [Tupaia chinensis]
MCACCLQARRPGDSCAHHPAQWSWDPKPRAPCTQAEAPGAELRGGQQDKGHGAGAKMWPAADRPGLHGQCHCGHLWALLRPTLPLPHLPLRSPALALALALVLICHGLLCPAQDQPCRLSPLPPPGLAVP